MNKITLVFKGKLCFIIDIICSFMWTKRQCSSKVLNYSTKQWCPRCQGSISSFQGGLEKRLGATVHWGWFLCTSHPAWSGIQSSLNQTGEREGWTVVKEKIPTCKMYTFFYMKDFIFWMYSVHCFILLVIESYFTKVLYFQFLLLHT